MPNIVSKFFLMYLMTACVIGLPLFILLTTQVGLSAYLAWLIALSVATFALYGLDKRNAASKNKPRCPETLFHGVALAGGFLGGWLGMYGFRHKTKHTVFQVVLAVATVLHLLLMFQFDLL